MLWIDILLVVLTGAFACVAIYRGIKLHGKGTTSFLVASIVLGALLAVPVETIEFLGTKISIRGPRLRDVSIEIESLSSQVRADELSVFLVPARNRGTVSDSGQATRVDFKEIPEDIYHVLVALLHGPEQIADLPVPVVESPGAVRIGHPERGHLVEYLAPNSVFNSLPRQRSCPHLGPDDRFVTIDRVLHHASLGAA